ncbi:MAG: diguanylate cyclase [Firmicutes bacterium]|nr:diguanylate cyclase [Bacillota bacterium]
MKKKIDIHSLYLSLFAITVIPIILLSVIITIFSVKSFRTSMHQEVEKGLEDLCNAILTIYDTTYEGDYHVEMREDGLYMLKGESLLNGDFSIIDNIKEKTGSDISVFYQDTRVLTTIRDNQGERVIGTKASAVVTADVLKKGEKAFYSSVDIEGKKFFAYYAPLVNSDGTCIGMIFVGKPSATVEGLIRKAITPIIIIAAIAMMFGTILTTWYSRHLVNAIRKIEMFLEKVAGGNFHAELEMSVLKRNDELGEMGKYAVRMERALQELVEQDILTKIHNRRSGEKMLREVQNDLYLKGVPFCLALGDIDHFKNVNDIYGHECGDVVLAEMAARMKAHMLGKGFVARWGGEEFLIVYQGKKLEDARKFMKELLDDIRNNDVAYNDLPPFHVTMTFGIVEGSENRLEDIIKAADMNLYYGKSNGRDQVVG